MTDIAQLAYSVDSSGLVQGERALDRTADAADKAGAAATKLEGSLDSLQRTAQASSGGVSAAMAEQEARLRSVAQGGVAYAESMRGANQSERSLSEAAREAAAGIDTKMQVMARSGTQQERMAAASAKLQAAEERTAKAAAEAARAHAAQELNLKKLLGQIDPTIGKLNQLASMEGRLEKALDIGAIKPELFDQYQAKIDSARAATLKMGQASEIATKGIGGLNLQSIQTQQSVASLARSLATGQWGMATTSITSLGARAGVMGGMFSAAGLAVGGAGAAVGAFTVLAAQGYIEGRKLEGMIIGMGEASGITAGRMTEVRNEIGRATGDYKGATESLRQLTLSGKVSGDQLESMARTAVNMSRLTGQSISATTSEVMALADGGAEGLAKLDERYNLLDLSTLRYIETVRQQQGEMAAAAVAIENVERVSADRAAKMEAQAGNVERAWKAIGTAIQNVRQDIKDWGRTDLEAQIEGVRKKLNAERAGGSTGMRYDTGRMRQLEAELESLQELQNGQKILATLDEQAAKRKREALAADAEVAKGQKDAEASLERRLSQMDIQSKRQAEINAVMQEYNRLSANDPRHFDGSREKLLASINKQYDDMAKREQEAANRLTKDQREAKRLREKQERDAQRLQEQYESAEASLARQIALYGQTGHSAKMAYDTASGALSKFSAAQKVNLMEGAQWLDFLDEVAVIEGVWADAAAERTDRMIAGWKGAKDEMSVYAEQAGKNMQDAFADFLFDPFDKGLGGMLESFAKTLQKMAAQAAAARIFEAMGAKGEANSGTWWGSMLSGMFGKREYGGSVVGGGMYQVGERNKPELLSTPSGQFLIPGDHGRVDPIRAAPAGRGGASSGPMQVIINNNGANQIQAREERQTMPDGSQLRRLIVDVIAEDTASGGRTWAAMKSRGGLRDAV